jgi:hypothetical protein
MVKIYAICLDAYPETNQLIQLMNVRQLQRSEYVCAGAFTCATLTTMISGCIGTEIFDGGIGYNTMYQPYFCTWRKNHCIIERLIDNNLDVYIHNHIPWFSKVLGGKQLTSHEQQQHYRDHTVCNDDVCVLPFGVIKKDPMTNITYSSANPELTLNTFLKWNFVDDKNKFYENEKQFIKYIQQQSFDGLFITDLCHWHEYVYYRTGQIKNGIEIGRDDALNDTISWLSNWDFNEPNSLFFIFADHSHRVCAYLDPPSHMTWVYYKDNFANTKLNPLIASTDFYNLVEQQFGLSSLNKSKWAQYPINTYDPSRIYAMEDGRGNSNVKTIANAFGRCCLHNGLMISVVKLTDNTNYPTGIYVMLTTLENKNTFTTYRFDDLNMAPIECFSIICTDPLSPRNYINGKQIYVINDDIIMKSKGLLEKLN